MRLARGYLEKPEVQRRIWGPILEERGEDLDLHFPLPPMPED
jgi:hypothetical protein